MNETTIKFKAELVKRLNGAMATANVAVAEAALAAVAQDKKITVRAFSAALRDAAPMLGTSTCVLAAAVKAAKLDNTTLDNVTAAMAAAADKKRRDDAKRAADRRDAAPGKALQKAQAEVAECLKAMRTPKQKAIDDLTEAEQAFVFASKALREARAARRSARVTLLLILEEEKKEPKTETTEPKTDAA